jgi:hypothetical protein
MSDRPPRLHLTRRCLSMVDAEQHQPSAESKCGELLSLRFSFLSASFAVSHLFIGPCRRLSADLSRYCHISGL